MYSIQLLWYFLTDKITTAVIKVKQEIGNCIVFRQRKENHKFSMNFI